eukprot:CAMPEP_0203946294 /NCGR_PEP_ID=MMETSP0359-20131031/81596_1 /ASSEMBLY_ACC=CAM_ASM_000338 /TAXON_ID=268821 /ORGANISM="Scrippsiella Hangoei, Strain SHTV-5" /LENGTH=57 /DNA_ID=CAMNT_0050877575 /DNA_START=557 /DNA_END=730 /DNA_ORIENTATION=-
MCLGSASSGWRSKFSALCSLSSVTETEWILTTALSSTAAQQQNIAGSRRGGAGPAQA